MSRAIRRDAALAAVVTLVLTAIVSFAPAPAANRFGGDSHDFAHVLIFGIMGLVLSRTLRNGPWRRQSRVAVTVVSLIAGLVFGVATEYAQGHLGGIPSWGDVARDMLGAAVGSCAAFALESTVTPRARRAFGSAVVLGLAIGFWPLGVTLLDYRTRDALLPVLLDPNLPSSLSFTSSFDEPVFIEPLPPGLEPLETLGSKPPATPPPAGLGIRVPLDHGPWPGVTVEEPYPDWRGWRAFVVEVANPTDAPMKIYVRVNDLAHDNRYEDRFDTAMELPARSRGRFEFPVADIERAPQGRRMNLEQIEKIVVHHGGPAAGRSFYLERLSLVR